MNDEELARLDSIDTTAAHWIENLLRDNHVLQIKNIDVDDIEHLWFLNICRLLMTIYRDGYKIYIDVPWYKRLRLWLRNRLKFRRRNAGFVIDVTIFLDEFYRTYNIDPDTICLIYKTYYEV